MLVANTIKFFSNNLHENGFCSQRRELLLSLTMTSPAHQQISLRLTEIAHFVYVQRFLKPNEKDQRRSLTLSWIKTRTNQKVKSDILTGLVSRITLVLYFAGSSGGLLLWTTDILIFSPPPSICFPFTDEDNSLPKSRFEVLAEQRDYKRRRQSYRAKNVHITKRSAVDVCINTFLF